MLRIARKITVLLILILFAGHQFYQAVILLDYKIATAAYARYCENKQKPQLQCNGKCQAMKKIRQEEQKEHQQPQHRSSDEVIILSSRTFFAKYIPFSIIVRPAYQLPQSNGNPVHRSRDIFHPPGIA